MCYRLNDLKQCPGGSGLLTLLPVLSALSGSLRSPLSISRWKIPKGNTLSLLPSVRSGGSSSRRWRRQQGASSYPGESNMTFILPLCFIVIAVTSLINIYAYWIEDGLLGRVLYMGCVITSAAGLWHAFSGTVPALIWQTLLALIALKSIRHLCAKYARMLKYRKTIHAKHKQ